MSADATGGHSDASEQAEAGLDMLSSEELLTMLQGTPEELETAVGMGCPRNPDGTFRFMAVLAWSEKTLGDVHGAKRV